MSTANTRESLIQDLQDFLLIRKDDALNRADDDLLEAVNNALYWLDHDAESGYDVPTLIKMYKANATDYERAVKQHENDKRQVHIYSSGLYSSMVHILEDPA